MAAIWKSLSLFTFISSFYVFITSLVILLLKSKIITLSIEGVENYILAILLFPAQIIGNIVGAVAVSVFQVQAESVLPIWLFLLLLITVGSYILFRKMH